MISIVVPMYNNVRYVELCIDSIVCQSYQNIELVIVDDGSTDGTSDIVDSYANNYDFVKVLHKENGGVNSARKAGAELVVGEYVLFVDGDDWIEPDYISKIADVIDTCNPDVVLCGYTLDSDQSCDEYKYQDLDVGIYTDESEVFQYFINNKILNSSPTLWAKCFKTEEYKEAQEKISDEICMGEDGCVSYPIIAKAKKVIVINNSGYHYRVNPDSLTRTKKAIPISHALWRIKYLMRELPISNHIKRQLAGYTSHSLFNSLLTNMFEKSYREVVSEAKEIYIDNDIRFLLNTHRIIGSSKERLAHFAIKHHLLFLIWVYKQVVFHD